MPDTHQPKQPEVGPVGRNLIDAVEELREARGLSWRKLSAALEGIGRPIFPLGLSRMAKAIRRVDVDELIALSIVLDVNPNALLFPRHVARKDVIDLTPEVQQRAYIAWGWARGRWPLPADLWPEEAALSFRTTEFHAFAERIRPDFSQPLEDPAVAELVELQELIELVLGDPDQARRWTRARDTIRRQVKLIEIRLEELFARLDAEAELDDQGTAADQLRVTKSGTSSPSGSGTLPAGTEPRNPVRDPFGKRDGR